MALAIDASTPAYKVSTTAANSFTSNSFSPPAGSLLAVVFAGSVSSGITTTITDSLGSHLTYTKRAEENTGATGMCATIWLAPCPSAQTSMTVTVSIGAFNATDDSLGVVVVTGAAATQNGATQTATSLNGTPSGTITSLVGANSLVIGSVFNNTDGTGPTIPGGQSDSFNSHAFLGTDVTAGSAMWAQYLTGMNLSAGASATINDSAPTGIQYALAMVEILAASGGGSPATPNPQPVNWPQAMWRSAYR